MNEDLIIFRIKAYPGEVNTTEKCQMSLVPYSLLVVVAD